MSFSSRKSLRKLETAIQGALPYHQQLSHMQIGQWPISSSEGKLMFRILASSSKYSQNVGFYH